MKILTEYVRRFIWFTQIYIFIGIFWNIKFKSTGLSSQ